MRILYFSRDYTPHDHRFLQALGRTEHKVYFLQLERRGHMLEDRPLPAEIEQLHWAGGRGPARLGDGARLWLDLKRVIRQVNPDLIQAGPLQRTAFLVALTGFRPLLSMSWGYDLLVDADQNSTWRWATRFTLKRSAALVGDCDTIRQLAIAHGMPEDRIVTFPWGIDLNHFKPLSPESSEARSPFVLLSTRGWESIYGVDIIARAFVTAARQCPELRLVMLGNGSLAATLRQIFAQGHVEDRVIYPGQVRFTELPRYYQMADLYMSASHSDGSSISLLEAMACGIPVLVSDIPGNREWVSPDQEGGNIGWLFPDGDADALAQSILRTVEQRERLPEMGRRARALAVQRADWDKNFPRLFEAYNIALSR
jgi:L-malate glycosyltransferase